MKNRVPFKKVLIHPIICDSKGDKMSKTKGNVINPDSLFNSYGLGTLGLYFSGIQLNVKKFKVCINSIILCKNILNKLWNFNRVYANK